MRIALSIAGVAIFVLTAGTALAQRSGPEARLKQLQLDRVKRVVKVIVEVE